MTDELEITKMELYSHMLGHTARIAELEAKLDAANKDVARMNHLVSWVTANSPQMDGTFEYRFNFGHGWKRAAGFRNAIDKAIEARK